MIPLRRFAFASLVVLAACTPALNWRETSPEQAGVRLLFPCRPERQERSIPIAGVRVRMQLHSCEAANAVFSLAFFDAPDSARVTPLLRELRAATVANLAGVASARPLVAVGATPNDDSALLRIEGRLPDGRRVVEHAALFVHGLRVYRASALGDSLGGEALENFFGSIRVAP